MHVGLQLMRWHSPFGALLLYVPCMWGLALAKASWHWYGLFAVSAWLMRSFGCVINDICDIKIDSAIPRTSSRPLACGKLSPYQALMYAITCLGGAGCVWLYLPPIAQQWSLVGLALACVYPLTKRFFFAPQLVLGITFNIGIIVAYTAMTEAYTPTIWWLWASSIGWTIAYDTVYAFHDASFDAQYGYFSTARYAQKKPHLFVGACLVWHIAFLVPILSLPVWGVYSIGYILLLATWSPEHPTSAFRFFKGSVCFSIGLWVALLCAFGLTK